MALLAGLLDHPDVPSRFMFDFYFHNHWATVMLNLIICAAVFKARGNVARLFNILRPE